MLIVAAAHRRAGLGFVHLASFGCASGSSTKAGDSQRDGRRGRAPRRGAPPTARRAARRRPATPARPRGRGPATPRPTPAARRRLPHRHALRPGSGVVAGAGKTCVAPCTAQTPCGDNSFCDPETPGATSGFCVPRSPAHCKTCAQNAECGGLSERCGTAAGDAVKACHVDCSIAGDAACPADYTCQQTTLDGVAAKVCRPRAALLPRLARRVLRPRGDAAELRAHERRRHLCRAAPRSPRRTAICCAALAPTCKLTCSTTDRPAARRATALTRRRAPRTAAPAARSLGSTARTMAACSPPAATVQGRRTTSTPTRTRAEAAETKTATTRRTPRRRSMIARYDDSSDPNISGQITTDAELHENLLSPALRRHRVRAGLPRSAPPGIEPLQPLREQRHPPSWSSPRSELLPPARRDELQRLRLRHRPTGACRTPGTSHTRRDGYARRRPRNLRTTGTRPAASRRTP